MSAKNRFGGPWTRIKIEILRKYLKFYTTALHDKFTLHYADAFAGTGSHSQKITENQTELLPLEDFEGSVLTALSTNPPFHRYYFNDLDPLFIQELWQIKDRHPGKDITIKEMDANDFVPLFASHLGSNHRAVLFVDPFKTEMNWETLKHVAKSKKIDMWLLFPLSALIRMTRKEGDVIPEWRNTLDRMLGTNEWEDALYSPKDVQPTGDLFDTPTDPVMERLNPEALQSWVKQRLEQEFAFVDDPVMLRNNGRPLFSLFLALANDSEKAKALARKVSKDIRRNYI